MIPPPDNRCWILVDNGSVREEAVRFHEGAAAMLSERAGEKVFPVSYDYSDRVGGGAAGVACEGRVLRTFVANAAAAGIEEVVVIPFFISATGGILKLVGRALAILSAEYPQLRFRRTGFLDESAVARALASRVRSLARDRSLRDPSIVVVDHGSPYPEASGTRDRIALEVARILRPEGISKVVAASMERRPGADYDHNEPLLARALEALAPRVAPVVLAQLFLGPGKHAGPDGDIARIAEGVLGAGNILQTEPLGDDPGILDALAKRMREPLDEAVPQFCSLEERERCPCRRAGPREVALASGGKA